MNGVIEGHIDSFSLKFSGGYEYIGDLRILNLLELEIDIFLIIDNFENGPYFANFSSDIPHNFILVDKATDDIFQEQYTTDFNVFKITVNI